MAHPRPPEPARLLVGMLSADDALMLTVAAELADLLGPYDYLSPAIPFEWTSYYDSELGRPIWRRFVSFPEPFAQDALAETKLLTNAIEQRHSLDGRRRVNLDPGYLTLAKLVLASTKDHAHRIYLGQGIYGEVTLHYQRGRFHPWPWTYPDYQSEAYQAIFQELRGRLATATGRGRGSSPR